MRSSLPILGRRTLDSDAVEARGVSRYDAAIRALRPGGGGAAGPFVPSPDSALTVSTWWACIRLLADTVASLPVYTVRAADGRLDRVADSSLVAAPSSIVTRSTWVYQLVETLAATGNAVGYVTSRNANGRPTTVEVLGVDDWRCYQRDALTPPDWWLLGARVATGDVVHWSAYNRAGSVLGRSPIEYAAATLRTAAAVSVYGADWFDGGGHPTSVLSTPAALNDDQATRAKERFRAATSGDHLAVLGGGWSYQAVQLNPRDSMFLETGNVSALDVCRWLGVPPELVGLAPDGSSVTYANRVDRELSFSRLALAPWCRRIAEVWSALLPRPEFVRFDLDDFHMVDPSSAARIDDVNIRNGSATVDEVRRRRNLPPLPDGAGSVALWPPSRSFPLPSDQEAEL